MQPHRATSRWRIVLVMIGAIVTIPVVTQVPARTDDQREFCGKSLDGWVEVFRHGSARDRTDAAWMLSYFGPAASKAVPALIEYLRQVGDVRREPGTVSALGRIGPAAAPAVPLLIPGYLAEGCNLAKMGSFGGGNGGMPGEALVGIGAPAVPALIDVLTGPNTEMRACAAMHLAKIGPAAKAAVPALVRSLRADQPVLNDAEADALRRYAVIALGRIGPDAREAVPALKTLLDRELGSKDSFPSVEPVLVKALDSIGEPPVTKLTEAFLRGGGCYELARLGPKARGAVPVLRKALNDRRPEVRIDAAIALISIDPPAPEAVRVLTVALEAGQEEAYDAPDALGSLGPAAGSALPVLIGLVEKAGGGASIEALVRIDPAGKACIPSLIRALENKDPSVVATAANALGLLGPRAIQAVPALAAVLKRNFDSGGDETPFVDAVKALGRIGPGARSAIPALIAAMKPPRAVLAGRGFGREEDKIEYGTAAAAARVLGAFGPEARTAVPTLIDILRDRLKDDDNWEARREAALALGQIGPDARAAVPVLRKVVDEGPPPASQATCLQVSDAAVVALFHLAPDGRALAENWVERSRSPQRKATVLGGIGRNSLEGELVSRRLLEGVDKNLKIAEDESDSLDSTTVETYFEDWFASLGRLGVGGGAAVPRLRELLRHPSPWIRQLAGETLGRITKGKTWSESP
jgi:HEAT repeat protein